MNSFLEKLKRGMGVENLQEEKTKEESKTEEKPKNRKSKVRGDGRAKKQKEEEIKEPEKLKIKEIVSEVNEEPKEELKENKEEEKERKIESKKESWLEKEGELTVDVYQTNGELVIQSAVAGVKPEDLDISIESDAVLIKGKRGKPAEKGEINYFYQECWWGPFSRRIILPEEADLNRAQATIKEGILTVRIPKIERNKKKKVEVKG